MDRHPLSELEEEELKDLVKTYLTGALNRLDSGNFDGASVRIANALGAMSFIRPNAPGIQFHTLLGFKLAKAGDKDEGRSSTNGNG